MPIDVFAELLLFDMAKIPGFDDLEIQSLLEPEKKRVAETIRAMEESEDEDHGLDPTPDADQE